MNRHVLGSIFLATILISTGCRKDPVSSVIRKAGDTENETERYEILSGLSERDDLDPRIKADLETLLPFIDYWANNTYRPEEPRKLASENSFLAGYFYEQYEESDLDFACIDSTSALYPIYCFYRGRMMIHSVVQNGKYQERWLKMGRGLIRIAAEAFPDNRIMGMYIDRPIEGWPSTYPADPDAPKWANLQRESLEKLTDIIYWWIDNRQLNNGEFGGGWGDDCEMWRWWAPVMIGFDDPVISASHAKFSTAIFNQPHLKKGYTNIMWDIEHTSEDTSDPITSMLHVDPYDSIWVSRALKILELMKDKWMGINENGDLQFKSAFMTCDSVLSTPAYAYEIHYHQRVVQPVLLYWLRSRDPELTGFFSEWYLTWVRAAISTDCGKPSGILPTGIGWPEGNLCQPGGDWNHIVMNYDFAWPGVVRYLYQNLLQCYYITGERRFLEPVLSLFEYRRVLLAGQLEKDNDPYGTYRVITDMGRVGDLVSKYRTIGSDTSFDDLLVEDADGYNLYLLNGETGSLEKEMEKCAKAFRRNWPSYTSEVRWTDRILSYNSRYYALYDSTTGVPDPGLLYSMVTGDPGSIEYFPLNAVRWHTNPRNIAVLVKSADSGSFKAELFNFGTMERNINAELFLLAPGVYHLDLDDLSGNADSSIIHEQPIEISETNRIVPVNLPPGKLVKLSIILPSM